jgi:nicotinic acid mononucleotide adenylyltransferase
MSSSVAQDLSGSHPVRGETPAPAMAKAALPRVPKREIRSDREKKEAYGRILKTVQHVLGYNRDQMADVLGVDARQLGRWYAGEESAQAWRYHSIPKVRRALRLVEALDDAEGATVETTITSKLDLGASDVEA